MPPSTHTHRPCSPQSPHTSSPIHPDGTLGLPHFKGLRVNLENLPLITLRLSGGAETVPKQNHRGGSYYPLLGSILYDTRRWIFALTTASKTTTSPPLVCSGETSPYSPGKALGEQHSLNECKCNIWESTRLWLWQSPQLLWTIMYFSSFSFRTYLSTAMSQWEEEAALSVEQSKPPH